MASAIKRSGTWYAKRKDAFGKPQRKATTAKTKKECEALAHELEVEAERGRFGLQPLPAKSNVTLGELCNWWLNERCPKKSADRERSRVEKHVIKQPIGSTRLPEVTPSLFDDRLREMEEAGASAASLNKLRAIVHAVFEQAIAASKWRGTNPISAVPTRKVPQRIYETLSLDEVRLVINAAGPTWRNLIATALYLGLRKGELFALRKHDVDLEERLLYVRRSHGHDTVKGKKALVLPVPLPLVQYLRDAMKRSPSEYVFPGSEGKAAPRAHRDGEGLPSHPVARRNRRGLPPYLPPLRGPPRAAGRQGSGCGDPPLREVQHANVAKPGSAADAVPRRSAHDDHPAAAAEGPYAPGAADRAPLEHPTHRRHLRPSRRLRPPRRIGSTRRGDWRRARRA